MYSERVRQAFLHPHNMGRMKKPDGTGKAGNIVCGDVMHLYIRVGKNREGEEILKDVKWETFGCAAAIATSSMITDIAKGNTLEKAAALSNESVVEGLGGLPPVKIHCSVLAVDALHEAVYDYFEKKGKPIPRKLGERHKAIRKEMQELEKRYKEPG